ncbi:MAG: putative membrane protein [Yoonia sp.]|jgi:putative membrane protein
MKKSIIYGFALGFVSAMPALADSVDGYDHTHMMRGYGADGYGMFLGPVFMLVLLAALIVGIVALIRWMAPETRHSGTVGNNALDALNLRLANGDIDAKEYADRKKLMLG